MKDISIEYAHIYTNREIDEEHHLSLQILEELKKKAYAKNKSLSLVVLIDDYSFPDPSFDYDIFGQWLAEHGHMPDIMLRESQLIPLCDEVLKLLTDQKLKGELTTYIKTKRYPCSLFIAAWYLLRLGYLSTESFTSNLVAKKLINVLPTSFKPYEDRGMEIIKATPFAQSVENISYRLIEGRVLNVASQ